MGKRLPHSWARFVFGIVLSGFVSFIVTGVATFRSIGPAPDFVFKWLTAWPAAWGVAFPAVVAVTPLVRRIVASVCRPPPP